MTDESEKSLALGNTRIIVTLAVVSIVTYAIYIASRLNYWKKRGFPQVPGTPLPFFGHTMKLFLGRKRFVDTYHDLYKDAGNAAFIGFFLGTKPCVLVLDPELIKNIMIKDFNSFTDRAFEMDEDIDPLNAKGLLNLKGQRWRDMRARLTPTFTAGRMKDMFPLMEACADELVKCLKTEIDKNGSETPIEIKEYLACFATDVIATCAFGIHCDALKNPETSEFRRLGKLSFKTSFKRKLLFALLLISPKLLKLLRIQFTEKESSVFFRNFVKDILESREKNEGNGERYDDFIHHLILLKKRGLHSSHFKNDEDEEDPRVKQLIKAEPSWANVTLDDLTAQVLLFFSAGFETTSAQMGFALYELSSSEQGKEIQQRLREEIDKIMTEDDGKITYEGLKRMHLLDRVLTEALRLHSPIGVLSRLVTQPYTIPGTDYTLEKGIQIFIANQSMQLDEKYFPNPKRFDPDRFLPENKSQWNQFTFLPFGEGPRICIGKRFSQLQARLGLAVLISKFEFDLCREKTSVPLKYRKRGLILTSEGGIWLRTTLRTT